MYDVLDISFLRNQRTSTTGATVFLVDMDHTLLNLVSLVAHKLSMSKDSFISPSMKIEGVNYYKILNVWIGQDSVYKDVISLLEQCKNIDTFEKYYLSNIFNEDVYKLLKNKLVVFVSSSYTKDGTVLKSKIIELYRKLFNGLEELFVPKELVTFADKNFEEHSYKNVISRLQLLGYQVICVDDNPMRLEWGSDLDCDTLLVSQIWNISELRYSRLGTDMKEHLLKLL